MKIPFIDLKGGKIRNETDNVFA